MLRQRLLDMLTFVVLALGLGLALPVEPIYGTAVIVVGYVLAVAYFVRHRRRRAAQKAPRVVLRLSLLESGVVTYESPDGAVDPTAVELLMRAELEYLAVRVTGLVG